VAIVANIEPRRLAKWQGFFGMAVIGGALMGLKLTAQILISLAELWLIGAGAPVRAMFSKRKAWFASRGVALRPSDSPV
jgi:hypothetical protein